MGLSANLSVLAGGEGEITWRKDGNEVDDQNVKKMDETSSKLVIPKATMEDAGVYSCNCEFESGHTDQITKQLFIFGMSTLNTELQLVVISQRPKLLLSSDGPWFGHTKSYHEFLEGREGMVPCLVTGQPAVDVIWLRDTKPITSKGRTSLIRMSSKP